MGTKILDYKNIPELQPSHGLWQLYQPETAVYRFLAESQATAKAWQISTRRALEETIGFQDLPDSNLEPELIETVDKGDYIREKVVIRTSAYSVMPVYILVPKNIEARPLPVVLALHGHGYGVKDIVGLWQDGEERDTPDGYHKDFAVALCRKGFLVAAPEISCFGERQSDFSHLNTTLGQGIPTTCTHSAMLAFHLGGSVIGLRVHDGKKLVDYLETRTDTDMKRLGAMGISGGGMHTLFSSCIDKRIKACVISGYYSSFQDSILAMHHCPCNFVPGLHQFGEMHDMIGLLAPRPLLIEAGNYDPIFPIEAVKKGVAKAKNVYRLFDREKDVEIDYFEGRHQISGKRAYDFLKEKLV